MGKTDPRPDESRSWRVVRTSAAVVASTTVGILLALAPAYARAAEGQPPPLRHDGLVHLEAHETSLFRSLRCMCKGCPRELLSTCPCGFAADTRERLRQQKRDGLSDDAIVQRYVAQYGTEALAIPPNRGHFRSLYGAPLGALSAGGLLLFWKMRRWRRATAQANLSPAALDTQDVYDTKLHDALQELDED